MNDKNNRAKPKIQLYSFAGAGLGDISFGYKLIEKFQNEFDINLLIIANHTKKKLIENIKETDIHNNKIKIRYYNKNIEPNRSILIPPLMLSKDINVISKQFETNINILEDELDYFQNTKNKDEKTCDTIKQLKKEIQSKKRFFLFNKFCLKLQRSIKKDKKCIHIVIPWICEYSYLLFNDIIERAIWIGEFNDTGTTFYNNLLLQTNNTPNNINHFRQGLTQIDQGIIYPPKIDSSKIKWTNIKNKKIKNLFLEKDSSTLIQNENFYFCYLHNDYMKTLLIYMAIISSNDQNKNATICVPVKSIEKLKLSKTFLTKMGIKKIIFKSAKNKSKQIKISNNTSRYLKIIDPFPMTNSDFYLLMNLANKSSFICSTGNNSFSQSIQTIDKSNNKILMTSLDLPHQISFLTSLISLAKTRLQDNCFTQFLSKTIMFGIMRNTKKMPKPTNNNFEELSQKRIYTIAKELIQLTKSKDFFKHQQQFINILKTEYNFEDSLRNIIKKEIACQKHPQLKQLHIGFIKKRQKTIL